MSILAVLGAWIAVSPAFARLQGAEQSSSAGTFTIRIPDDVSTRSAHMFVMVDGVYRSITPRAGVREYPVGTTTGSSGMKLLLYLPGYQIVAQELGRAELASGSFMPQLVPLPALKFEGRVVNGSGQPVPNEGLRINYELWFVPNYFNLMWDGVMPSIDLGTAFTDMSGSFTVDLPAFADDPFFAKYAPRAGRGFTFWRVAPTSAGFTPFELPVQKTYERPTVVVLARPGTIVVRLGPGFLRQNGFMEDLTQYADPTVMLEVNSPRRARPAIMVELSVAGGSLSTYFLHKGADDFTAQVPPGTYVADVTSFDAGGQPQRKVSVATHVVIREGMQTVVDRP